MRIFDCAYSVRVGLGLDRRWVSLADTGMMYGLTMTLKNEIVKIAPRGRVNTVAPGWVYTPMAEVSLANPDVRYSALAT